MDDSRTAVCVEMRRAVGRAMVISPRTDTQSLHAYRFALSDAHSPSTVPALVTRNRLGTVHPSFQGESVSS